MRGFGSIALRSDGSELPAASGSVVSEQTGLNGNEHKKEKTTTHTLYEQGGEEYANVECSKWTAAGFCDCAGLHADACAEYGGGRPGDPERLRPRRMKNRAEALFLLIQFIPCDRKRTG